MNCKMCSTSSLGSSKSTKSAFLQKKKNTRIFNKRIQKNFQNEAIYKKFVQLWNFQSLVTDLIFKR